jgi:hypothetical protein
MTDRTDILLNQDNDLLIAGGDLVVKESLNQQVGLLLLLNKGELKQHPLTGVGIYDLINTESMETVIRETRQQMQDDGLRLLKLTEVEGKIYINAEHEQS